MGGKGCGQSFRALLALLSKQTCRPDVRGRWQELYSLFKPVHELGTPVMGPTMDGELGTICLDLLPIDHRTDMTERWGDGERGRTTQLDPVQALPK